MIINKVIVRMCILTRQIVEERGSEIFSFFRNEGERSISLIRVEKSLMLINFTLVWILFWTVKDRVITPECVYTYAGRNTDGVVRRLPSSRSLLESRVEDSSLLVYAFNLRSERPYRFLSIFRLLSFERNELREGYFIGISYWNINKSV